MRLGPEDTPVLSSAAHGPAGFADSDRGCRVAVETVGIHTVLLRTALVSSLDPLRPPSPPLGKRELPRQHCDTFQRSDANRRLSLSRAPCFDSSAAGADGR